MQLKRLERYYFLQIFGDGKEHTWNEVAWFCIVRLNLKPVQVIPFVQNMIINHRLIRRISRTSEFKQDSYMITERGDECLRLEQIARDGDYTYYKFFDRTESGPWGLDKFAPLPPGYKEV